MSELEPGPIDVEGNQLAVGRAKIRAYRFKKGQSGNPSGNSRFYFECRKIAQHASPDMMRGLVELAKTAEDERVRSVCLIAVLDRAGLKPIEAVEMLDQLKAEHKKPAFNPADFTLEELERIEAVLRLVHSRQTASTIEAGEAEIS